MWMVEPTILHRRQAIEILALCYCFYARETTLFISSHLLRAALSLNELGVFKSSQISWKIHLRQTNRIHVEDVMKPDPLIDGLLSISLVAILALPLALFRLLS